MKTPAGKPLVVPNKSLAMAVSVEWNSQVETIKPANMHLVCTSVTLEQKCVCYIKYTIGSKTRGYYFPEWKEAISRPLHTCDMCPWTPLPYLK